MPKEENKTNEMLENAALGFAAGAITGGPVSIFERFKVELQSDPSMTLRRLMTRSTATKCIEGAPVFSLLLGAVCATEISTNAWVKKTCSEKYNEQFGMFMALCAAATGGAIFLTPADHLMYRAKQGISYSQSAQHFTSNRFPQLFTGFMPMLGREFMFGFSLLLFGPALGEHLKSMRGNTDPHAQKKFADLWWNFAGTFLSGLMTTTLSQPLDTMAREMQIMLHATHGETAPTMLGAMNRMTLQGAYRGFGPRLFLATTGGAMIGTFFKAFKQASADYKASALENTPSNPKP